MANALLGGVFGLLIGSFLNVVIYRLPVMMYRGWLRDCLAELVDSEDTPSLWSQVFGASQRTPRPLATSAKDGVQAVEKLGRFNLVLPNSRCGHCGAAIRWYQNVPVLSYLALRGKCASCGAHISLRYPTIELLTGLLFALCGWRFGLSVAGGFWAAFAALLLCQFMIDLDTQYLPDSINYILLWLGLIGSVLGATGTTPTQAVWGAVGGYACLWLVFHGYRLLTGKEGLGYGDFKLLAALGAWLGGDYLIAIVLVSSMVGAVLGITMLIIGKLAHKDIPLPFGPFLAGAGLVCLVIGPQAVQDCFPFAFPFRALAP